MSLLSLRKVHLSYGHPALLDDLDFSIEYGQRICLIGRNGEGKSTLMKIIAGEIKPDEGSRVAVQGARVTRLEQEVPEDMKGRVFDVVADGLGDIAELIKTYHATSHALMTDTSDVAMAKLSSAQQALEEANGWSLEQQVETVISKMKLDPEADFLSLSGGMKRRVLLARALAGDPDLLLLDEPTNHLDIAAIQWLEEFLLNWKGTLLFITHDRQLLRNLATRIVELDRGKIADFPGDYDNYLRRREEMDNAEAQENARFDKMLAQEEIWIRQGIKARRTRNQGRVRRLESMREEYGQRRSRQGKAKLQLNTADRSGKLVCEANGVSYAWEGNPVIANLTTTILRGDRIGIVGPNGCGKSTLLQLLLGQIQPDQGQIDLGTKMEVAYFDQLRNQLNEDATVLDNVAEGSDKVVINGTEKHVISYLQDFLFSPKRSHQPVRALSGGERNRLLLAKIFTKPANVLVLDEPTNDLDMETLELLEELLMEFQGTLMLVSHDRAFLDNVVTSTLVFDGDQQVNAYVGGYTDWERQRPQENPAGPEKSKAAVAEKPKKKANKAQKLSYKDQRELEQLPKTIEELEVQIEQINNKLADPELYKSEPEKVTDYNQQLQQAETALEEAFERWEALEALANPSE